MRRVVLVLTRSLPRSFAASRAAAQVPARVRLGAGRQHRATHAAGDQCHGHPDPGAARPRALRGGGAGPAATCSAGSRRSASTRRSTTSRASWSPTATTSRSTSGSRSAASAAGRTSGCAESRSCSTACRRRCRTARASSPTWSSRTSAAPRCSAAPAPRSTATPRAASSRFETEPAAQAPFAPAGAGRRAAPGSASGDDFYKWQSWSSGRAGNASGTLSLSQFKTDGFRQHSAAEIRQLNAGVDYTFSGIDHRHAALQRGRRPRRRRTPARSPSPSIWPTPTRRPAPTSSAAPTRTCSSSSSRSALKHVDAAGNEYGPDGVRPAARPEEPARRAAAERPGPTIGTYVEHRSRGRRRPRQRQPARSAAGAHAPRLTAGADVQRMRDDRQNFAPTPGVPTDSVLIDQREKITEFGPFTQLLWSPGEQLLLSGGVRYDWVRFDVTDHHLDRRRGQQRRPHQFGAQRQRRARAGRSSERFIPYANVSTSFETPTTTELVNQPDGAGGFNDRAQAAARGQLRGRRARPADAAHQLLGGAVSRPDQGRHRAAAGGRRARLLRATPGRPTTTARRSA